MDDKKNLFIKLPPHLKDAGRREAARRGITLSALVKNYLSQFLPRNIETPIKQEATDNGKCND